MKKLHMFFMVTSISMCLQAMDTDHEKTVQIDLSGYMQKIKKLSDAALRQESINMQEHRRLLKWLVAQTEAINDTWQGEWAKTDFERTIQKSDLLSKEMSRRIVPQ